MTRDELFFLFKKYLKREPDSTEIEIHSKKNYDKFEKEIDNCFERRNRPVDIDRVAILLSGHIRRNSIKNTLRSVFEKYDYDVFIHTWDNIGIKGNETKIDDVTNINLVKEELSKIQNVISYDIENNAQYIKSLEPKNGYFNFSSPEPFIKSQLYSINKSYKLLENHISETGKKYSLVVKLRFDSEFTEFRLDYPILDDINNHKIIFVTNKDSSHEHPDYGTSCWMCDNMYYKHRLKDVHIFEHTNVICDLFAYGNVESMKDYCSLYEKYDYYNDLHKEINLNSLKKHNKHVKLTENGDYKFLDSLGHINSLYYYYCSYPERLLQVHLKDYMLVESKGIKLKLVR